MHLRTILPVLFSIAGIFSILVPFIGSGEADDPINIPSGGNTFSYELNSQPVSDNTFLSAEVVHENNLFHLTLWMGANRQDRITFVLKETEITEGVYELDDQNKRYLSFEFQSVNCTYTADESISGVLMINDYDRERQLIRGSFEFMAISDNCNELVRVRNGKFDATYSLM
ncbi:MAG TPA: DUF6252 family protein [Cyclobacteriaceae bacterium]|nr:DUF6252 family protein [Cyclobacteriaceae bacterium]